MAAAIANAFAHATAKRLRHLPFNRGRVKAAFACNLLGKITARYLYQRDIADCL
jgi:hypothetical protein